jgi:hypothetical protein
MRTRFLVVSALLLFGIGLAADAAGQSASTGPSAAPAAAPRVNAEQLGLNLSRIQRGLQRSAERQEQDGLNLRYYITVSAPAPTIKLFTPLDNLLYGQAPYGGPTHRDMMEVMTPKEFSAPAADLGSLARWFGKKVK